jgi:hypothetical protein
LDIYIGILLGAHPILHISRIRINSISEYLLCAEAIQVLNLSETLASLRQINLGSLFLDPEDNRKLSMGATWNLVKGTGLLQFTTEIGAQRACLKAWVHRARKDYFNLHARVDLFNKN